MFIIINLKKIKIKNLISLSYNESERNYLKNNYDERTFNFFREI
jgi:hypothetical protein